MSDDLKNFDPLDILGVHQTSNLFWDPFNLLNLRDEDDNYDPWLKNRNKRTASTQSAKAQPKIEASPIKAADPKAPLKAPPLTRDKESRNSTDRGSKDLSLPPNADSSSALPVKPRAKEPPGTLKTLEPLPEKQAASCKECPGRAAAAVHHPASATSHTTASRQCGRGDFEIAIICALAREYDAVSLMLDGGGQYEEDGVFRTGRIGKHNVVLAVLSEMGKSSAATTAASLYSIYRVRLVFLVGICGGVPQPNGNELLLGDVVISKNIVQYDFGSQYSNEFRRKDGTQINPAMSNMDVANLLGLLETADGKIQLQQETADNLRELQDKATQEECGAKYSYPGINEDKLFHPYYRHKHNLSFCICSRCVTENDPVCDSAIKSSCTDLRCNERYLVPRRPLEIKRKRKSQKIQDPAIHVGAVGSADRVVKSGKHRDEIAMQNGVIALEMEGAGIMKGISCVIVKGVCDYADSHKNKKWQDFAAATAASALKAILNHMPAAPNRGDQAPPQRHLNVPLRRNKEFVGRESELKQLLEKIPPSADPHDCQMTSIEGLGGIGKTQIAFEAAYRVYARHKDCSIFWVRADNSIIFHNTYRDIGRLLNIPGVDDDKAETSALVKSTLSQSTYSWLLIVENADDDALLSMELRDYFPDNVKGSILFTTRSHDVVSKLDIGWDNQIHVNELSTDEGIKLLKKRLGPNLTKDTKSTRELLNFLDNFPLAIKQASAYMNQARMTTSQYLRHCRSSSGQLINLLGKDFEDQDRYLSSQNPIATTWLVSFRRISEKNKLAADYMSFMSFLAEKEIPKSLLPPGSSELETDKAIGLLKAYSFITEQTDKKSYYMHGLVRLAMQNWLAERGELETYITAVLQQLDKAFLFPDHRFCVECMSYLPHALRALEFHVHSTDEVAKSSLLQKVRMGSFGEY